MQRRQNSASDRNFPTCSSAAARLEKHRGNTSLECQRHTRHRHQRAAVLVLEHSFLAAKHVYLNTRLGRRGSGIGFWILKNATAALTTARYTDGRIG